MNPAGSVTGSEVALEGSKAWVSLNCEGADADEI